jgi:hypothetical protein
MYLSKPTDWHRSQQTARLMDLSYDLEYRPCTRGNNGTLRGVGVVTYGPLKALFRPWMRPIVDLRQLCSGQLCIALRRGEPLMPQQFLDGAQICSLLQ